MGVKQNFLWEVKKAGIIEYSWVPTMNNKLDMFAKNLVGLEFNKHAKKLCGHDKYYNPVQDIASHEQERCQELQGLVTK